MTPVIFRKERRANGDVFALFPTLEGSPGCCMSYQHVGQHGSADYAHCIQTSRPATSMEYGDLLIELIDYGYDDLRIYERRQPDMR